MCHCDAELDFFGFQADSQTRSFKAFSKLWATAMVFHHFRKLYSCTIGESIVKVAVCSCLNWNNCPSEWVQLSSVDFFSMVKNTEKRKHKLSNCTILVNWDYSKTLKFNVKMRFCVRWALSCQRAELCLLMLWTHGSQITFSQSRFMVLSGCSVCLELCKSSSVDIIQMNRTKTKLPPSHWLTNVTEQLHGFTTGAHITLLKLTLILRKTSQRIL